MTFERISSDPHGVKDSIIAVQTLAPEDRSILQSLTPYAIEYTRQGLCADEIVSRLEADFPDAVEALAALREAEGVLG